MSGGGKADLRNKTKNEGLFELGMKDFRQTDRREGWEGNVLKQISGKRNSWIVEI